MRRIFTLSFAIACLFATQNLFAQTVTCSETQTTPTFPATTTIASTSGASFTWTNTSTPGQFQPSNTVQTKVTSPIMYYNTSQTDVSFAYNLLSTKNNGSTTVNSYTISIVWGSGTSQVNLSCTGASFIVSNTSSPYVFTISNVNLPASTNFQVSLALEVQNGQFAVNSSNFVSAAIQPPAGAALPVHFSKVAVSKAAEGALVTWNVGTEQNVSGYDVEKSTDGRSFTKIGFVAAAGLSSYSFADTKAGVVNFYRIKSVDVDGKYSFSTVVALNNGAASVVVKAFMSDKNTLTVQHDAAQAGSRISVVSMDGRVVKMQLPTAGAQQTTVDLSNAQTGLYIVRYDNGQGGSQSIKVAK